MAQSQPNQGGLATFCEGYKRVSTHPKDNDSDKN